MAFYRGLDGSLTFGGVGVAQLISWSINTVLELLDASVMGTTWRNNKAGMAQWTANAAARLDYVTGQQDIIDKVMAASPDGTSTACIFVVSSTGPKQFTGNAVVTGVNLVSQTGNIVEVQFTLTGDGALTPSWV